MTYIDPSPMQLTKEDIVLVGATNPFSTKGQWYKGNLHTHTTNSDGELSLKQIISSYKERGHDFLGITDHDKVTYVEEHSTSTPLLIGGIEISCGHSEIGESYHIVTVGLEGTVELPEKAPVQEVIDILQNQQGIVFLGHPYWSGLTLDDILPLKGILGIEVFNAGCLRGIGKGVSAIHWDDLLAHQKNLYGFAVDDTHFQEDIGHGCIMVKAESLSAKNILSAIRGGEFYSSCGPMIENIVLENNVVTVSCSEVAVINFICAGSRGVSFRSEDRTLLTSASYELSEEKGYLRVEVIDLQGKTAWSQPLSYEKMKAV